MENQNTRYCTIVLNVVMVIAGLSTGHPITCFNPVTPVLQRIYNQTYFDRYGEQMPDDTWTILLSFSLSVLFLSALISSLVVKSLVARFTKIRILIGTHVISLIGHIIVAIGTYGYGSYEAFIAGRFVVGLAVGLGLGVYGVWVNEICVPDKRSLYAGLLGTWYLIGALYGILMGWPEVFGTDDLWIGVIVTGMAISVIFLIGAYWIPDSPLQIMQLKGPGTAREVLKRLRTEHGEALDTEIRTMTGDDDEAGTTSAAGILEVMKTPQYRKHFFGVVIVYSNITACGLSNVLFFSDAIFLTAGLDPEIVTVGTIAVFIIGVIVSFSALFAMRKLDPKTLVLIASVVIVIGDALMTTSLATNDEIPVMSVVAVIATCIFFAGFSIINMVAYVIIAAICIDRTRGTCMTVATVAFWFFAWFVGFISPYLDGAIGPYAFMVWMAISIANGIYAFFCVPKISGKSEEEIQKFYKKSS